MVINHTNHILIIRMGQPEIQDMCLSKLTLNTKTLLIVEQKKKKKNLPQTSNLEGMHYEKFNLII